MFDEAKLNQNTSILVSKCLYLNTIPNMYYNFLSHDWCAQGSPPKYWKWLPNINKCIAWRSMQENLIHFISQYYITIEETTVEEIKTSGRKGKSVLKSPLEFHYFKVGDMLHAFLKLDERVKLIGAEKTSLSGV